MKVQRTCPVCQTVYDADPKRLKWGRQTTCSRACSYKLRATEKEVAVWFVCSVCGKQVRRTPSTVKGKHGDQFCSRECHYRGRSLGLSKRVVSKPYAIPEATREEASRRASLRIANGTFLKHSELEDKVAEALAAFGVAYRRQFPFYDAERRRWNVADFFLPELNMLVEVNDIGSHVDPRAQARSTRGPKRIAEQERDEARRRAAVASGYLFRELWEADLRKDIEESIALAVGIR
jgi:hypothetical protein